MPAFTFIYDILPGRPPSSTFVQSRRHLTTLTHSNSLGKGARKKSVRGWDKAKWKLHILFRSYSQSHQRLSVMSFRSYLSYTFRHRNTLPGLVTCFGPGLESTFGEIQFYLDRQGRGESPLCGDSFLNLGLIFQVPRYCQQVQSTYVPKRHGFVQWIEGNGR